jgi:glycine betaine/proline transport system ATP-binding protein
VRKTVVFITHDLDEALRLGDRIAILRDGEVIQQGTGQEIVLQPADDYIAKFVKEVNRGRVLRVSAIMRPLAPDEPAKGIPLSHDMSLAEAMRLMTLANADAGHVVDDAGKPIGRLEFGTIVAAMVMPDGS